MSSMGVLGVGQGSGAELPLLEALVVPLLEPLELLAPLVVAELLPPPLPVPLLVLPLASAPLLPEDVPPPAPSS
jgi:hypothetical protein